MNDATLGLILLCGITFAFYFILQKYINQFNVSAHIIVATTSSIAIHSIDYVYKGYLDSFFIISGVVAFFIAFFLSVIYEFLQQLISKS